MVLDIVLFRAEKGGNPELVRESQKRRFGSVDAVQEIIELDAHLRETKHSWETKKAEVGKVQKEIAQHAKEKKPFDDLKEKKNVLEKEVAELQPQMAKLEAQLNEKLNHIGNIVHASVPVSSNEDENAVVAKWGEFVPKKDQGFLPHYDVLAKIDGYDSERGTKVAGNRGYFLKGIGFRLNQALINYGVDFLLKKGYTPIQTPFFMNKDAMAATAQLSDFDEQLYKVVSTSRVKQDGVEKVVEEEEKYLIATSEQPISALHMNEYIDEDELPIRYTGYSTCFRKEAGSMRDARGIFRVHQFEKIEQFCITHPDKSWEMHEEMLHLSEEFYQSLGIPYQVVVIVSGALNNAASKKYDLEGWFPAFEGCRELVSCSNCTDYQSRSLNIRLRGKKDAAGPQHKFVHMLNSTLCATTRTICAILENFQTPTGVEVPKVLQPYLGGLEFIKYVEKPTKGH